MRVEVTHFTDPACPFAFSAEPIRLRLRWTYGEQLSWRTRMIVLTREPGEAEKLAGGAPGLQRHYGMPIDPAPYPHASSSEPACLASAGRVVRARQCPRGEEDALAARRPTKAARLLDHKLGGPPSERRYTAPSYELASDGATGSLPGFNPFEAYDAVLASIAPELDRRAPPESVAELLAWAGEPLATAEVVALSQQDEAVVRTALGRAATPFPSGADLFWHL